MLELGRGGLGLVVMVGGGGLVRVVAAAVGGGWWGLRRANTFLRQRRTGGAVW